MKNEKENVKCFCWPLNIKKKNLTEILARLFAHDYIMTGMNIKK
jgi:hypothetical protein